jgi:small nuclear ribonucleoprotein (snRNP)-like protein
MSEDGVLPEKAGREKKIMNLIVNTSIILMSTLMGGLTEAMMNLTEAMASGVAGALGGEEAEKEVGEEFKAKLPEVDDKMKTMISDVRKDMYIQMEQEKAEIEPYLSDPVFDGGPKKVEGSDFGLPKLTEELDDGTIAQYAYLLVSEDQTFGELFGALSDWMNNLPMPPKKTQEK